MPIKQSKQVLSQISVFQDKKERFKVVENKGCPSVEINSKNCTCSYISCSKRGKCCECLRYHLARKELPACVFPPKIEKTYDRSIERFVEFYSG